MAPGPAANVPPVPIHAPGAPATAAELPVPRRRAGVLPPAAIPDPGAASALPQVEPPAAVQRAPVEPELDVPEPPFEHERDVSAPNGG
jgi:hypothetical protein